MKERLLMRSFLFAYPDLKNSFVGKIKKQMNSKN
jgi:hypothetical protein